MDWEELGRMVGDERGNGKAAMEITHVLHIGRDEVTLMLEDVRGQEEDEERKKRKRTMRPMINRLGIVNLTRVMTR